MPVDPEALKRFRESQQPRREVDPEARGRFADSQRSSFGKALYDIPKEIVHEYEGAVGDVKEFGRFARGQTPIKGAPEEGEGTKQGIPEFAFGTFVEGMKKGGKALGGAMYAGSPLPPIVGAAKSVYGHAAEGLTGRPYEKAKSDLDAGLLVAGVASGARNLLRGKPKTPPKPELEDEFGVTKARGPVPPRGRLSQAGEQHVREFEEQQHTQAQGSTAMAQQAVDPITQLGQPGEVFGDTARQGGELIQRGARRAAARSEAEYNRAYDVARAKGGEIRAIGLQGLDDKIRAKVSDPAQRDPVFIDDPNVANQLTPNANKALAYLRLQVEGVNKNNLDNLTDPNSRFVGLSLDRLDLIYRQLARFAYSATKDDKRAAVAVVKEFESQTRAMGNTVSMFRGDRSAFKAWDLAREEFSEHQQSFGEGSKVGKVVSKIISGGTTASDAADFAYGGESLKMKNSLIVGVAKELKAKLGETSEEWIGAKQGLISKLTEKDAANRIRTFMSREVADVYFSSPQEKSVMSKLAQMHDALGLDRQPGDESGIVRSLSHKIANVLNLTVGGTISHLGTHGIKRAAGMFVAKAGIGRMLQGKEVRDLEKNLPIVTKEMVKWRAAMAKAQRSNARRDRASAYTATYLLSQSLRQKFGINMGPMQPPDSGDKLDLKRYGGPQQ